MALIVPFSRNAGRLFKVAMFGPVRRAVRAKSGSGSRQERYGGRMLFSRRKTGNNAAQDEGMALIRQAIPRTIRYKCSRALALMALFFTLNRGPILAIAAETAQTSS